MAFRSLERMSMGQDTLDKFLLVIKRCPFNDYDDQGRLRDVREAKGRPNEARKILKDDVLPTCF